MDEKTEKESHKQREDQEEVLSSFSARSSFSVPAHSGLTSAERLRSMSLKLYRSLIDLPIGSEVCDVQKEAESEEEEEEDARNN